jgi:hypothetical protein
MNNTETLATTGKRQRILQDKQNKKYDAEN